MPTASPSGSESFSGALSILAAVPSKRLKFDVRRRDFDFRRVLIKVEVAALFTLKLRMTTLPLKKLRERVDAIFDRLLRHVVRYRSEPRIFAGISKDSKFFAQVVIADEFLARVVSRSFPIQRPIVSKASCPRELKQARPLTIVRHKHDFKRLQHLIHRRSFSYQRLADQFYYKNLRNAIVGAKILAGAVGCKSEIQQSATRI